jgi:prepilin-type N-terminal cleavage/methylation domain-containing protein
MKIYKNSQKGMTLVEVIVCVAIFAILSVSVYGIFTAIINGIVYYREKTTISSLADQYLEVVRNMPYSKIGTIEGNPNGTLPDLPNVNSVSINGISYQVYYAISYVDDPADGTALLGNDPAPNDYKQVKLYVKNTKTNVTNSFLTNVSPKGLEGLASGGALSLKVINAVGQPVPGAIIHITNNTLTPNIDLTRTADSNGNWVEVGLPNSANSYSVSVAKSGYSSDQTYPISAQNQNPTKPNATISNGQVTQISFAIDQLSNLVVSTLNPSCSNSSGQVNLNNIEWDTYTPALSGSSYMIYGTSPIQQINLLPATSQNFNFILGPKTSNSLLVIVKDSATGNPIQGAQVDLQGGNGTSTGFTDGSLWSQQGWAGGAGQTDFSDATQYFQDDGNIDNSVVPSGLRLAKIGSNYIYSGSLVSSTFDTGTSSTSFAALSWQPTSQDPTTSIKFQIAANNDKSVWNFIGPDGTSSSYYTVPGTTIKNENNNRYIRYKVFLSTTDSSKTPVLTSVNIYYVSGCSTPGQIMFPSLQAGSSYQTTVSMDGYQPQTISNINVNGYSVKQVLLSR